MLSKRYNFGWISLVPAQHVPLDHWSGDFFGGTFIFIGYFWFSFPFLLSHCVTQCPEADIWLQHVALALPAQKCSIFQNGC